MIKHPKIPATMASQHPDNAGKAWWSGTEFISVQQECEECYLSFHELGAEEYMWDWEGKFVDEAVVEKLFRSFHEYFKKHSLGKHSFLTFRIPNIWREKNTRVARAFMSILTSEDFASEMKFHTPPIFEVILPMTENADQLMHIKQSFHKIAQLKHDIFHSKRKKFLHINIIPLFEGINDLMHSKNVLEDYLNLHLKEYGQHPSYLRPFIARSDPALHSGYVPAVLANKVALSQYAEFSKKHNIPVYPIIGVGGLPFRGGCNPANVDNFMKEYAGIRTVTIQSAFRYDYPLDQVKSAIKKINKTLPKLKAQHIPDQDQEKIKQINKIFEAYYQKSAKVIAHHINRITKHIPARRERILHIGLVGYGRKIGKTKLPRAIPYTGALYSLGIPPEFIGLGRGLKKCQELGLLPIILKYFHNIKSDLEHAGHYVNRENIQLMQKEDSIWKILETDIDLTEKILNIKIGPIKEHHFIHRNLVSSILQKTRLGENFDRDIIEAAMIRKSIG